MLISDEFSAVCWWGWRETNRPTEELETHCWMKNVNRETLSGGDLIILKTEIQALLAWFKVVTLQTCI